jgi:hypothetical protein
LTLRQSLTLPDQAHSFPLSALRKNIKQQSFGEENIMKKTIVGITAAAFLGGTAVTVTPVPAAALYPIFLGIVQPNPNFKSVNPYDKKASKRAKKRR